jgi:hypothetical protein
MLIHIHLCHFCVVDAFQEQLMEKKEVSSAIPTLGQPMSSIISFVTDSFFVSPIIDLDSCCACVLSLVI